MQSTLDIPNHISWREEPRYSASVAAQLAQAQLALDRLKKGSEHYRAVVTDLSGWQYAGMASQQLTRMHFLLGSAHGELGEHHTAISHYAQALEVAARLRGRNELDAVANSYELLYRRALQYRAIGHYGDASHDLQLALALVQEFIAEDSPSYGALQLRLLAQLAGYAFFLGHFDTSTEIIASARKLIPLAPELRYEAALVAWADAHLARTLGKAERAFQDATAALPLIAGTHAPTQVRFHAFLAEAALDVVEQRPQLTHTRVYDEYMRAARHHMRVADTLAMTEDDVSGALLSWLIRMRQYRLARRNYDRVADIEVVMRQGQRVKDRALLVQAMMTLGDEFEFQREPEAALSWYRQALGASDGSQEPAIKYRALRKVCNAGEGRAEV